MAFRPPPTRWLAMSLVLRSLPPYRVPALHSRSRIRRSLGHDLALAARHRRYILARLLSKKPLFLLHWDAAKTTAQSRLSDTFRGTCEFERTCSSFYLIRCEFC